MFLVYKLFQRLTQEDLSRSVIRPFDIWYKGLHPPPPWGRYMGFPCIKIFVCLHTVVRPSSCGMLVWRRSSEGHYTSFTTKCRSCVLPAANFWTKFREEREMAPKSREEEDLPSCTFPLPWEISLPATVNKRYCQSHITPGDGLDKCFQLNASFCSCKSIKFSLSSHISTKYGFLMVILK